MADKANKDEDVKKGKVVIKDEWKEEPERVGENKEGKVVSIIGTGTLEKFKFDIKRLKEKESRQEKLLIQAYYASEDYGTLVTSIGKLYSDITKLSDNGINLKRKFFVELAKIIDDNFYYFLIEEKESVGNNVTEDAVQGIAGYFMRYIRDNRIEVQNGCYNIPVEEFSREYKGTTFRYDEKDVREALRLYGYTKCNSNRNDLTVKLGEDKKAVKCISFIAEKIDKEG